MLLDALGVLLGGPWGPKRFKANQPEKLEKQWKTDDAKNSPNHYAHKLKRILIIVKHANHDCNMDFGEGFLRQFQALVSGKKTVFGAPRRP